jgi:uncharacterized membrane protein YbhN (UPF0104 family)
MPIHIFVEPPGTVDRQFVIQNYRTENLMPIGKKNTNWWIRRLGIPLAAIPIIWIYWRLDFHSMIAMLPKVAWWTTPVLFSFVISCMTLQGVRWWILLHAFIPELPLKRALAYHFMGVFYGTAIPTGFAQDVIKTLFVAQKNSMETSWAAFWVTRALGLPVLAILSMIGFFSMDKSVLPRGWEYAMAIFYLLVGIVFIVSFSKRITRPVRIIVEKWFSPKIILPVEKIREGIYRYRQKKTAILQSFVVTLVAQICLVLLTCLTIKGITGFFFIWECFTFIPLIELLAVSFPFTPNGIGAREALSAAFFAYLHLSKEHLGIYVMLALFFSLVPRLFGFPLLIHGYRKQRAAANEYIHR